MTTKQLVSAWHVTTDPLTLRRMGKLGEECGELLEALGGMVANGRKSIPNSIVHYKHLEHEIADVLAQCACSINEFFEPSFIEANVKREVAMIGASHGWGALVGKVALLSCVASRIIIQGIDEVDPSTQLPNRTRLGKAIVSVVAHCQNVINRTAHIDRAAVSARAEMKQDAMQEWEELLRNEKPVTPARTEAEPVFVVDHVGMSYGSGPGDTTVIVGYSANREALTRGAKLYR